MELFRLFMPDGEKKNIELFMSALLRCATELGYSLDITIVGGATTKPWPRKDIDLLCKLYGITKESSETQEDFAQRELTILYQIAEHATSNNENFAGITVAPPLRHRDFDQPDILISRGSIKITQKSGIDIEMIGGSGH